jgi:ketosteroid isomerase-like protein
MTTQDSDLQALHKIHDDWIVYYNTGNVGALLALYDTESVIMPRGRQRISGVEAVKSYFERLFARGTLTMQSKLEKLEINGNWAIQYGLFTIRIKPHDGGPEEGDAGRYFILLRKHQDGRWTVYQDLDQHTQDAL